METFDFSYQLTKVYFIIIPHLQGIFFTHVKLGYLTSTQFLKSRGKNSTWNFQLVKFAITYLLQVEVPT